MQLSPEQLAPIEAALAGHSLLLTGGAGTGKSATLHALIEALRGKYANRAGAVAVLAPTGVAALNVGGRTIHAWAKWPSMTREKAATKQAYQFAPGPWRAVQVLIVDEISMVSDWLLELMDRLGRAFRDKSKPFGGIQLVLCGDFLQLAPIEGALCFKSRAWHEAHLRRFELTYAFRQGADGQFAAMLAEVRTGQPSDETLVALQSGGEAERDDNIEPTLLYTTNAKVDGENRTRLAQLPGAAKRFVAQDSGEKAALKHASSWTNAPDTLDLKLNAQVVLLRNLDIANGLVNGSRGVVVGFSGEEQLPVVRFACGTTMAITRATWTKKNDMERTVATRVQLPLALAWALTVHKAQGMSLDRVRVDLSGSFAPPGAAYVALSRCRTLAGLRVTGLTRGKIRADADAMAFYAGGQGEGEQKRRIVGE